VFACFKVFKSDIKNEMILNEFSFPLFFFFFKLVILTTFTEEYLFINKILDDKIFIAFEIMLFGFIFDLLFSNQV
jgi:hypothetical protein